MEALECFVINLSSFHRQRGEIRGSEPPETSRRDRDIAYVKLLKPLAAECDVVQSMVVQLSTPTEIQFLDKRRIYKVETSERYHINSEFSFPFEIIYDGFRSNCLDI